MTWTFCPLVLNISIYIITTATWSISVWRIYCNFNIWPNDLDHAAQVALWYDFHRVWIRSNYLFVTYNILLRMRYVTLRQWALSHWPRTSDVTCSKSLPSLSDWNNPRTKNERNRIHRRWSFTKFVSVFVSVFAFCQHRTAMTQRAINHILKKIWSWHITVVVE